MGWTVKPSASTKIERREAPYLTEAMRREASEKYLPRFETKRAALLPVLHMVQHEYGHIPHQALEETAAFLELTPAEVLDSASFYEEFWLKPKGRHTIAVCRSIACEFCGHTEITDAVRERLSIDIGDTTDDGRFTLVELECIGACGGAPAALVDEDLHEHCSARKITQIIDQLRERDATARNGDAGDGG